MEVSTSIFVCHQINEAFHENHQSERYFTKSTYQFPLGAIRAIAENIKNVFTKGAYSAVADGVFYVFYLSSYILIDPILWLWL